MIRKIRHSDEEVRFWAEVYTELNISLEEIERELEISHSTMWWCFTHRLPYIDYNLYKVTMELLNDHKHHKTTH